MTLNDEISGIKATVDFDDEIGEFVFDIDGEPFENLVYLDPSFSLEDTEVKLFFAQIEINNKIITDGGGQEWAPHILQFAIYAQIGDDEAITSIKVTEVKDTSSAVINEILGLLAVQKNITDDGLEELEFCNWNCKKTEPLDQSVL